MKQVDVWACTLAVHREREGIVDPFLGLSCWVGVPASSDSSGDSCRDITYSFTDSSDVRGRSLPTGFAVCSTAKFAGGRRFYCIESSFQKKLLNGN